jgi:hypothetical protein
MEKIHLKPIIPTRAQKIALYLLSLIMFVIGLFIFFQAFAQIAK